MKRRILVLIAIFSFAFTVNAQFGIDKLKKKIKKKPKPTETKTVEQNGKTTAASTVEATDAVMLHHTILTKFNMALANGLFKIDNLRAMNLPTSADGNPSVQMKIKKADGTTLASYETIPEAPKRNVSWFMSYFRYQDEASRTVKLTEGDYYLEFSVHEKPFDKFAFSVAKHKHVDGKTWMVANGVWDELGFLEYNTRGRRPIFRFSTWMRDFLEGTGVRPDHTGKHTLKIIREKDGKVIGISNPDGNRSRISPLRNWKKFDFYFQTVENVESFDAKSILAQDGKYHVEFIYEDKPYGKYPFAVKNGQFQGIAEHNGERLGTDGTIFWMPRQK